MFLTDGRRIRRDIGPGNGIPLGGQRLTEAMGYHLVSLILPKPLCPICEKPAVAGRVTCGKECLRVYMNRASA